MDALMLPSVSVGTFQLLGGQYSSDSRAERTVQDRDSPPLPSPANTRLSGRFHACETAPS